MWVRLLSNDSNFWLERYNTFSARETPRQLFNFPPTETLLLPACTAEREAAALKSDVSGVEMRIKRAVLALARISRSTKKT